MNVAQKIIAIVGAFYVLIGGAISIVFLFAFWGTPGGLGFLAIPMLFVILGIAFIIGTLIPEFKKNSIKKHGDAYKAKIYGYVENTSYRVNGRFPINVKVHYFDKKGIERKRFCLPECQRAPGNIPLE